MKIKTSEAARKLGIHPARLLQYVAELNVNLVFSDVWPLIDRGYVDTISAMGHHLVKSHAAKAQTAATTSHFGASMEFTAHCHRVLDKLTRQAKWGSVSVSFEALLNLTRLGKRDLERAITELRKAGLLDHDGTGRGTISLNSSRRDEIESIAQ